MPHTSTLKGGMKCRGSYIYCRIGTKFPSLVSVTITTHNYLLPLLASETDIMSEVFTALLHRPSSDNVLYQAEAGSDA